MNISVEAWLQLLTLLFSIYGISGFFRSRRLTKAREDIEDLEREIELIKETLGI